MTLAGTHIERQSFGATPEGKPAEIFTLSGEGGLTVRITNYAGPSFRSWRPTAPAGRPTSCSASRRSTGLPGRRLLSRARSSGATATASPRGSSRSTARIHARQQQRREPPPRRDDGASTRWSGAPRVKEGAGASALELTYLSKDGEEGYPGQPRRRRSIYTLDGRERAADRLHRHDRQGHRRQPDQPRLLQPGRRGPGDILGHEIADRRRPVHAGGRDADPDRRAAPVEGTPFDFTQAHRRSARASTTPTSRSPAAARLRPQLRPATARRGPCASAAARHGAEERPRAGSAHHRARLQFYTGNFLDGTPRRGRRASPTAAQRLLPRDAALPGFAQQAGFPSVVLKPGETYRQTTVYRFTTAP